MSAKGKMLCVDPGETVGWSIWEDDKLVESGQTALWEFGDAVFDAVFSPPVSPEEAAAGVEEDELVGLLRGIQRIVCEDWALYPKELKSMAWDQCRTARLIGSLTQTARKGHLEFVLQPALIKERALAAGAKELFVRPLHDNRHQNDSIMHGVYFIAVQNGASEVQGEQQKAKGGHVTDAS